MIIDQCSVHLHAKLALNSMHNQYSDWVSQTNCLQSRRTEQCLHYTEKLTCAVTYTHTCLHILYIRINIYKYTHALTYIQYLLWYTNTEAKKKTPYCIFIQTYSRINVSLDIWYLPLPCVSGKPPPHHLPAEFSSSQALLPMLSLSMSRGCCIDGCPI